MKPTFLDGALQGATASPFTSTPRRRRAFVGETPPLLLVLAFAVFATPWREARADDPSMPTATAPRALEFRFTPTARTQIALWIEKPDGTFVATVRLTQAVSLRGIGNRPGASQMNSGYRWPYGRRLDVLPVWAHRRAAVPNAGQFNPVIFQHRTSEGCASNAGCGGSDSSPDAYFCLSFAVDTTRQNALDAMTCASVFSSDKGRYLTSDDVTRGYSEPAELAGAGMMRPLERIALYPPRRDDAGCGLSPGCIDHADAARYSMDALQVMPELDTVTMATPAPDVEETVLFTIPDTWTERDYVAWIEVNVEGDHNSAFDSSTYRTPVLPAGSWDSWAAGYGYAYRGQPSVVFSVPFSLGASAEFGATVAAGYGDVNGFGPSGGALHAMDGIITNDPQNQVDPPMPGSGVDRLHAAAASGYRFRVVVRDAEFCKMHDPPAQPTSFAVVPDPDERHSHQWGRLHFVSPASSRPIDHYEVRYSKTPINPGDTDSFEHALPALAAETDSVALRVPTSGAPGTAVDVPFGGLDPLTHYYVAIRAVDSCNVAGPFSVAELTTTRINFTQLSGCFVATAAYGSAMEPEVGALRRVRDAVRARSAFAATVTDLYYRSGPAAAAVISRSEIARAVVRSLLAPIAEAAAATGSVLPSAHH